MFLACFVLIIFFFFCQADTFPVASGPSRRGRSPPAADMNEGVIWLEWREKINQDVDLNDIFTFNTERGPLINSILVRKVVGPEDPWLMRSASVMYRLQLGEAATIEGVKITHVRKGVVAVEYPGSSLQFVTETAAPTSLPTVFQNQLTMTTRPGTVT